VLPLYLELRMATMALWTARRRSLLLGSTIALVTSALVLLHALSGGTRAALLDSASALVSGHLNLNGLYKLRANGRAAPVIADAKPLATLLRDELPGVRRVHARGRGFGKLFSDRGALQLGFSGVDLTDEPALPTVLRIEHGALAALHEPDTVLLFARQAERLDVQVGDSVTVVSQTASGAITTADWRVGAIARDLGLLSNQVALVSAAALASLYQQPPEATGALQLELEPSALRQLAASAAQLRYLLAQRGYRVTPADGRAFWLKARGLAAGPWSGQRLDVSSWEDELSSLTWTLRAQESVSALLLLVLLAVTVLGVMNLLWVAVRERASEIATLRALGMHRAGVLRVLLFEAALLGALGSLVGALLAALAVGALNHWQLPLPDSLQLFLLSHSLRLSLEPVALARSIGCISCATVFAAIHPALSAALRPPAAALDRTRGGPS
jgi:putative ABC transport system permease protein